MALWDKITSRGNVEDRRGFGPIAFAGGGLGLGGIALILLLNYLGGGNIGDVLQQLPQQPLAQMESSDFSGEDSYEVFASTVLGSTDDYWSQRFSERNQTYPEPTLVLFRGATQGGCGISNSAVGPHYCSIDGTIYLDETFFDELTTRLGAQGGDVAEAYVIAHEVGHHVQNVLNLLNDSAPGETANETSIRQELQADCFAGLWASSIKDLGIFETNEITEAINAAAAIGDDKIQQTVEGRITPENWTHGSSEQRVQAFTTGYDSGSPAACGLN